MWARRLDVSGWGSERGWISGCRAGGYVWLPGSRWRLSSSPTARRSRITLCRCPPVGVAMRLVALPKKLRQPTHHLPPASTAVPNNSVRSPSELRKEAMSDGLARPVRLALASIRIRASPPALVRAVACFAALPRRPARRRPSRHRNRLPASATAFPNYLFSTRRSSPAS